MVSSDREGSRGTRDDLGALSSHCRAAIDEADVADPAGFRNWRLRRPDLQSLAASAATLSHG
ncbi:MAG TPA: hypothetical protein VI248_08885 [Kineosporiaceae bacterium]